MMEGRANILTERSLHLVNEMYEQSKDSTTVQYLLLVEFY